MVLTLDELVRRRDAVDAGNIFEDLDRRGLVNFPATQGSASANATGNARANRAAALKQLTIQRKKLEFQQKTGLRDIGQAREKGLKGAINNALQRGVFRSGIRIENEAEVNRESDEARDDLKTNIQFALDDLAARREGVEAQKFGGSGGTAAGGGPLTIGQAEDLSLEEAAFQRESIFDIPTQTEFDPNQRPPSTGVVPIVQPGGPR